MSVPKITFIDVGGTTVRLSKGNGRNYLWLMQPSDTDEHRYAPAESIQLFLSDEQLKAFGIWLTEQVPVVST